MAWKLVRKFPAARHGSKRKILIKMDVRQICSEDKIETGLVQIVCEKRKNFGISVFEFQCWLITYAFETTSPTPHTDIIVGVWVT